MDISRLQLLAFVIIKNNAETINFILFRVFNEIKNYFFTVFFFFFF